MCTNYFWFPTTDETSFKYEYLPFLGPKCSKRFSNYQENNLSFFIRRDSHEEYYWGPVQSVGACDTQTEQGRGWRHARRPCQSRVWKVSWLFRFRWKLTDTIPWDVFSYASVNRLFRTFSLLIFFITPPVASCNAVYFWCNVHFALVQQTGSVCPPVTKCAHEATLLAHSVCYCSWIYSSWSLVFSSGFK